MRRPHGWGLLVPFLLLAAPVDSGSAARTQNKPVKPQPAPSRNTATPKITATSKNAGPSRPHTCTHTVRSGESLGGIALRHRVSRMALIGANRLADPNALRSGRRLLVPGCRRPGEANTAESRAAESSADGTVVKRVGPRRILTALVLIAPDFQEERIPLVWPVEGPVISAFGQRRRGWHAGIDITADLGSQVYAAAPGTVIYSGWIRSYGQVVKVQHSNGFITLYAHNLKNQVEAGDEVEAGQVIATVGSSGHSTGPHVHFEVRRDGKAYNPLHLLEPSDKSPVFEGDVATSSSPHDLHE